MKERWEREDEGKNEFKEELKKKEGEGWRERGT